MNIHGPEVMFQNGFPTFPPASSSGQNGPFTTPKLTTEFPLIMLQVQMMKPSDYIDPMTFPLAPPSGQTCTFNPTDGKALK